MNDQSPIPNKPNSRSSSKSDLNLLLNNDAPISKSQVPALSVLNAAAHHQQQQQQQPVQPQQQQQHQQQHPQPPAPLPHERYYPQPIPLPQQPLPPPVSRIYYQPVPYYPPPQSQPQIAQTPQPYPYYPSQTVPLDFQQSRTPIPIPPPTSVTPNNAYPPIEVVAAPPLLTKKKIAKRHRSTNTSWTMSDDLKLFDFILQTLPKQDYNRYATLLGKRDAQSVRYRWSSLLKRFKEELREGKLNGRYGRPRSSDAKGDDDDDEEEEEEEDDGDDDGDDAGDADDAADAEDEEDVPMEEAEVQEDPKPSGDRSKETSV